MRFAAVVLTGCWSNAAPVAPTPVQSTNTVIIEGGSSSYSRASRPRREGLPRHSVWEGTYVCNQGLSSVRLTIDTDRRGNTTARYDFGPVPSNPSVPYGAYLLTGILQRQDGGGFTGEFEASEWIVQPTNYFMVPLTIETGDGKTMKGTIQHPSCKDFQATRIE